MNKLLNLSAATVLLISLVGCQTFPQPLRPPGTIGYQRSQAVLHDPFPSNDLGPPIMGGRPREFDRPLAEVVDSQGSPFARQRGEVVQPDFGF